MLWSTLNTLLCKTFVISSLPTSSPPHRRCRLVLLHIYIDDEQTYILTWLKKLTIIAITTTTDNWTLLNNLTTIVGTLPNNQPRTPVLFHPLCRCFYCSNVPLCVHIYMQFCMFTFVTNPIYTKSPCNSATTFGNITNTSTTTTTTTNKQHLLVIWTKWKQNLQYFVMHCVLFCLLDNDDDGPEDGC